MGEKKATKISLSTFLLIIAIIIIIVMGGAIYKLYNDKKAETKRAEELQAKTNELTTQVNSQKENISELQGKIDKVSETVSEKNSTNTNSTKMAQNQNNEKNTELSKLNLDNYIGEWYESEKHKADPNPNSLTIKSSLNSKLVMDLYITRTANFDNFETTINGNLGTFEVATDNGNSTDNQPAKISGKLELSENTIKLTITKSNVVDLNSGSEYNFKYKSK